MRLHTWTLSYFDFNILLAIKTIWITHSNYLTKLKLPPRILFKIKKLICCVGRLYSKCYFIYIHSKLTSFLLLIKFLVLVFQREFINNIIENSIKEIVYGPEIRFLTNTGKNIFFNVWNFSVVILFTLSLLH